MGGGNLPVRGTILAVSKFVNPDSKDRQPPTGMTSKRILLVIDDKLLLKLYQEKIEENGFVVSAARDMGKAAQILADKKPDVVLLDLVFQEGQPTEFLQALRADPANEHLPVLILPNLLGQASNEALQAGATRVISCGASPIAGIIDAIRGSLGMPFLGASAETQLFKPDEFWIEAIFANALDSINRMRHCLPGIAGTPPELPALHELWNYAHAFAQKTALLSYKPFAQIAGSFDMLLHDLNQTPDQLNPSTIRTVGQALDFLATISTPECLERLTDPAASSLLVVDDEDGARQFITSALELAGLKSECAESPASAIEKLNKSAMNLIFLDVGLPEMNGFELCTKVRAIEQYKNTPIVFLTGMATFQNKAKASLSGGNDFVGKPFNLPELGVKALMWLCRGQLAMV
jgi:CheY-like chemotaxis protein